MPTVQDPSSGLGARVEEVDGGYGRLWTSNRTPREQADVDGRSFHALVDVTPAGGGDFFFYLENLAGSGYLVHITSIKVRCAAAEVVQVFHVPVTNNSSASPTAITPTPAKSSGISLTGRVKVEQDPDLTTITTAVTTEIDDIRVDTADTDVRHTIPSGDVAIVEPGLAMCLQAETGTNNIDATVSFYLEKIV